MEAEVTMKVSDIIMIVGFIAVPLATAVIMQWKQDKVKSKVLLDLTKTFTEANKDNANAIRESTKDNASAIRELKEAVKELPRQFELLMKANHNGG